MPCSFQSMFAGTEALAVLQTAQTYMLLQRPVSQESASVEQEQEHGLDV